MKKIFFSFLFVLIFSLSALCLFETKNVSAFEYEPEYHFRTSSQFVVKYEDGSLVPYNVYQNWPTVTFSIYEYNEDGVNFYLPQQDYVIDVSLLPDGYYIKSKGISLYSNGTGTQGWSVPQPFDGAPYSYTPTFILAEEDEEENRIDFIYISGYDGQGGFVYITKTIYYQSNLPLYDSISFSQIPQPLSFEGKIFRGWDNTYQNSVVDIETSQEIFEKNHGGGYYRYEAQYSVLQGFTVSFYDLNTLINSFVFDEGVGTIIPPYYKPSVGSRVYGWALEPNGQIIDLSTYNLTDNLNLFAITQPIDVSVDDNFKIPYEDCSNFDIPCHLGNAFLYFLNEFPLISDVVKLFAPVSDIFELFAENIQVFDTLGWIFIVSMAVLFISFIVKFLR